MKLPKYDNTPPPGTPLYHDPDAEEAEWTILKFGMGMVFMLACLAYVAYATLDGLRNFFV